MRGIATLEEIERSWSLVDVLKGNEYLDAWDEAQAEAQQAAEKNARAR